MKRWSRKLAWTVVLTVVLALVAASVWASGLAEKAQREKNGVREASPYEVSERARRLHESLFVADLHADPLLWSHDLTRRNDRGHVDLPRLLDGNVALQGFGVVTKSPKGQNIYSTPGDSDQITQLAIAQRWPPTTWGSLFQRAVYQSDKLEGASKGSDGRLVMIRWREDLADLRQRRGGGERITGGILGLEGAHALEGKLENVDRLFAAGVRMVGLAHFFDNDVAGSAHGVEKGGLTQLGRQVVSRLEELGVVIDLAHASPRTINEVLDMAERPVVVSHTGVRGTCDNPRNLSDRLLRRIAQEGGVVGIGVWERAVCGTNARATARAMRHAASVMGVDHVALGTDFDGAVTTPFDASGLAKVTEALLALGVSEADIRKIMGGNTLRLLESTLPPRPPAD